MKLYCFQNDKICPSQEILIFADSKKEAWEILKSKSLEKIEKGYEEDSLYNGATLDDDDIFDINKGLLYYRGVE